MNSLFHARLLSTLNAAVTVGLAALLPADLPPTGAELLGALAPLVAGAALSQWLLFPLFARRPAPVGVLVDVALWFAMIGLAGIFAGTLILPGPGTVLGPMMTLSLPIQSPLSALVYGLSAGLGLWLIRRAKAPQLAA